MMSPAANSALDAKAILADRKRLFTLFRDLQLGDNKEWLVKGLLGHGEASAFYGKPGDGKSVLVQDLCPQPEMQRSVLRTIAPPCLRCSDPDAWRRNGLHP